MTTALHTTDPTPVLDPTTLSPALRPLDQLHSHGLSDDGFCDSLTYVTLSRELGAGLSCAGTLLSHRGLGELDLSAHRGWDLAADNLLRAAQTTEGTRFLTRPAATVLGEGAPGLQIATPGAHATDWLAHPHTFTVLDDHLTHLSGAPVTYLAPTPGLLLALPATPELPHWARRAVAVVGSRPVLCRRPLVWRHGFPALRG